MILKIMLMIIMITYTTNTVSVIITMIKNNDKGGQ